MSSCTIHKLRVWLFYDELDAGFGSTQADHAQRKRALEALFAWWLEHVRGLSSIIPKILLREDIWNKVHFTNKAHYSANRLSEIWGKQGKNLNTLISDMIKAGIMREYQQEASRYAVAELYLYGLGMRRKGQR